MNSNRCSMIAAGVAGVVLGIAGFAFPAHAQYPNRPITLIISFAAGGPTDTIGRIAADHMSRTLGQPIVIENVVGAGGTTGVTRGATSAPDGYTITYGHMGSHGAAPALYPNLKYDPVADFEPVGMIASTPVVIVAKPGSSAANLGEFMAYARANKDSITTAHAGIGSVSHVSGLLLNSLLGIKPPAVAYRGTGPALNDLIGGQFDFMCDQIANVASQVQGGRIKALAIATAERSPALPDLPTAREAGLANFEVSSWNALFVPKGTPPEIVAALNAALGRALDDPATRQRLLDIGNIIPTPAERTQQALGKFVSAEVARWTPILKAAGVSAN